MDYRKQLVVWILCASATLASHGAQTATVLQVIEGDTCRLNDHREVRYLGIDAPEKADVFSEEATQVNNRPIGGKTICLEIGKPAQDRDGRVLAYVFLDKEFINAELVLESGTTPATSSLSAKPRVASC